MFSLNSAAEAPPCHEAEAATGTTQHTSHASHDTLPAEPVFHGDCAQCSTCQVCHSVVLSPATHPLPVLALPTLLVHSGQALFASVPRAPHLKPPIS